MTGRLQRMLLLALALPACEPSVGPAADAGIAVQTMLFAGRTTQYAWVEQVASPDSTVTATIRPIDPTALTLGLRDDSGQVVMFTPTATPARFSAPRQVSTSTSYQLVGSYAGTAIHATCRVPAPIVVTPAGSVHLVNGDSVILRWNATAGSGVYALGARALPSSSLSFQSATYTSDTSLVIRGLPPGNSLTEVLYVMAIDSVSAGFFAAATTPSARARGNIDGARGACGGATVDSVVVVYGP